jgi:hypothetical protein
MMKKGFLCLGILVLVLVFGMTVVGCKDDSDSFDSGLFGTWRGSPYEEGWIEYTFSPNGAYSMTDSDGDGIKGNWSAKDGILTITVGGESESFPYTFRDGALYLGGNFGPFLKQ